MTRTEFMRLKHGDRVLYTIRNGGPAVKGTVVETTRPQLRNIRVEWDSGYAQFLPDFLSGWLHPVCCNCGELRERHTKEGRCLFASTTYAIHL